MPLSNTGVDLVTTYFGMSKISGILKIPIILHNIQVSSRLQP